MKTNYSKLKSAIDKIENQYNEYLKKQQSGFENPIQKKIYKTALVKCFETSFEMAWKHLKKYLQEQGFNDTPTSPKTIFRKAHEAGAIEYIDLWLKYCETRNNTSHDYSDEKVFDALKVIGDFIKDLKDMYETTAKND